MINYGIVIVLFVIVQALSSTGKSFQTAYGDFWFLFVFIPSHPFR